PAAAPQPPAAPAADPKLVALQENVQRWLGRTVNAETQGKLPAFRVTAAELHDDCRKLRAAGFDYLLFVTAVDYPADKRFELVYLLTNFQDGAELCVVANVDRSQPEIDTVSDIWETAEWHEREVYDMFGIRFRNHRDLRRILLEENWPGHPLRKDYVDQGHNVIPRPY
ncbi:MAG: NADH-quinone oxidoreductase subunit C, partial [Phycisphaeraceae bacterium]|nr:NADH-quinone oxidoreductase subunit C [Phycisphaeraceae bacterium]